MLALAQIPITKEDYIKRVIAYHLDQAFISNSNGTHTLFTFLYKDFDVLVNEISKSVINVSNNPLPNPNYGPKTFEELWKKLEPLVKKD